MVSIAPIKYISINAASSFELLLLIKYMQKNLLLFLVVTKAHICMILRIKVHTCASESKLLNLIQKSSTFYYAKLMVYRQPCCELMMLFIFHIKLYDTHTHKTAVHTSFIMFHNTFILDILLEGDVPLLCCSNNRERSNCLILIVFYITRLINFPDTQSFPLGVILFYG